MPSPDADAAGAGAAGAASSSYSGFAAPERSNGDAASQLFYKLLKHRAREGGVGGTSGMDHPPILGGGCGGAALGGAAATAYPRFPVPGARRSAAALVGWTSRGLDPTVPPANDNAGLQRDWLPMSRLLGHNPTPRPKDPPGREGDLKLGGLKVVEPCHLRPPGPPSADPGGDRQDLQQQGWVAPTQFMLADFPLVQVARSTSAAPAFLPRGSGRRPLGVR